MRCRAAFPVPASQKPPFISVTHKGSPGKAFVQTEACAVSNTCMALVPRPDARALEEQLADMFLHAALITSNSWRFDYARTCSRERIAGLPLDAANSISAENRAQLVKTVTFWLRKLREAREEYGAE
jgi:type I restriction enzyme M protein